MFHYRKLRCGAAAQTVIDSSLPSWFPGLMSLEAAAVALWVAAALILLLHNIWKGKTTIRSSHARHNRDILDSKVRRMRRHT